jgi:hypothetical protein
VLETYVERRRLPRNTAKRSKAHPDELTAEERFALRFVEGWESRAEPLDRTLERSLAAARR